MSDNNQLDYIQERVDMVVDRVADVRESVESLRTTFEYHVKQDDQMREDLSRITTILDENTFSLKEHIRRTNLLEDYVKSVDARVSPIEKERMRKKAAYEWIVAKLKLVAKLGAAISALGAIAVAAKHVLSYLLTL